VEALLPGRVSGSDGQVEGDGRDHDCEELAPRRGRRPRADGEALAPAESTATAASTAARSWRWVEATTASTTAARSWRQVEGGDRVHDGEELALGDADAGAPPAEGTSPGVASDGKVILKRSSTR
jgi:hypothetical protein